MGGAGYDGQYPEYNNAPVNYGQPIGYAGYEEEHPAEQPKKKKKKKKPAAAAGGEDEGLAAGDIDPITGEVKKKKKKKKKVVDDGGAGQGVAQGSPALQRISIHAQPGTQVSITPRNQVESTF